MNITQTALKKQLQDVVDRGWWPHLEAAAEAFFGNGFFDAYDLFAVGSRESNWNPKYLTVPGDNGNGFGPMQIDKRSYPQFVASGKWRDPKEAIRMGAAVLKAKLDQAYDNQGHKITVRTRSGESYSLVAKKLTKAELKHVALAAYNSGLWSLYHASKGRSPDHGTTGADYGQDVLERAAAARKIKVKRTKVCPKCHGTGRVAA